MSDKESILQLVKAQLEIALLSLQQQEKTLEACEARLKILELEKQRCLAKPKSHELAELTAAVEAEQRQVVNVRKMIKDYNEMVAKAEVECLGKKALQEMRTLKKSIRRIKKIEKTITELQDIRIAVQKDNSSLEAEPHIQKADLGKENIQGDASKEAPGIGDGRGDISKATRLAAGEEDLQMAAKQSDLTLPATNKDLFKEPAKKGGKWHAKFIANMSVDGRKAATNEDPKGDAANNKDLLKPTKNREHNLKEDFPKGATWHKIFMANMKEDSRKPDDDPNAATKGYQRLAPVKEDLRKSDLKNPATREDFPKNAKWHEIFKANMTGDSLKPVQRVVEANPKDNESFDERNAEVLRLEVEEQLLKASYYHQELRWLHDLEKMTAQIKEQNQREIEQEKKEFQEKESNKEIQPVEGPSYGSRCGIDSIMSRAAFHRPPRCKEMAEMRASVWRSWNETKAKVEAALAEKEQCLREIDELEASFAAKNQARAREMEEEEKRLNAVQVSYTFSSFSSGESHACPHRTLVGQNSPSANEYLVDQSPVSVQPPVHEQATRWLSPVASNVDSSPGDYWRQLPSVPEGIPEDVEEQEEEEEEDMASFMTQFRANGQIFSHLLMVTHILDGHLRVRLGRNYNDARLLEVKRDAIQMFEEQREPTGNCLRWRQLAGKMVLLMTRMLQQYYDMVDAQIARFA